MQGHFETLIKMCNEDSKLKKKPRTGTKKLGPLSLKVKKRPFDKSLGQGLTVNLIKSNYYWKEKDTREKRWAVEGTGAGHIVEANTKTKNTRQCKLEALNSSRRWGWCRWETDLMEELDLSAKLSACRGQKYSNWTKSWKKPLLKAKDKSESTFCQKYQLQKRKSSKIYFTFISCHRGRNKMRQSNETLVSIWGRWSKKLDAKLTGLITGQVFSNVAPLWVDFLMLKVMKNWLQTAHQ